jgi:hypothetical protein
LFENTAFDIPKNDLFEDPLEEELRFYISLNAQIRFTS